MISDRFNFIFFHVPKAAGSSIISGFRENFQDSIIVNEKNTKLVNFLKTNNYKNWPNHTKCQIIRKFLGEVEFDKYFKFAFVRNPFDKLVSIYHYVKQKEAKIFEGKIESLPKFNQSIINSKSFEHWIKDSNLGDTQYDFLTSNAGELLVNYVGKTEYIQADLSYVYGLLNISNMYVSKLNASKRKDYRKYFDTEAVEIIRRKFKNDIYFWGYDFEGDIIDAPYKNRLPDDFQKNRLLLHTNEVGLDAPKVVFSIDSSTNYLFKEICFSALAFNKNVENPGCFLNISLYNNDGIIQEKKVKLSPQKVQSIALPFAALQNCKISFTVKNIESVETNRFCGIYVSPLIIR